jgi:soluble lytic murein transglycosylase-like protein
MLGLRDGGERRNEERRHAARPGRDRRRAERRWRLRSLLLTGLALFAPHQGRHRPHPSAAPTLSGPHVTTHISSVEPIPPEKAYDRIIREAAAMYHLDPALIRSVMQAESGFDPSAVSRTGALGLMQLMPGVAEGLGVEHPFDPRENIMAGARLLRKLLDMYRGNVKLAIASYNAGPGAVARHGGRVPPFRETRTYVKRVTQFISASRRAANDDE